MHGIPCLTAFVAFPPFRMLDKCPFSYSRKRVDGEVKMKEMFLLLSPSSLSVGLQSSPFLYILTIFLQMKAHDEVRPLLCLPAQIDRLSAYQFGWNKIGLLVGFKCFLSHLGTDTSLNSCTLSIPCRLGVHGILCVLFVCWSSCFRNRCRFL